MFVRDYTDDDRADCCTVFDSNVPDYFGAQEQSMFEAYLDDLPGPYLVIEDGPEIVACGGMATHKAEAGAATLCWGMVLRSRHGTGLGKLLLFERLRRLNNDPAVEVTVLNTSQFCAGFFTKMGFMTRQVMANGYFPGMDKHEMSVRLPYVPPGHISS